MPDTPPVKPLFYITPPYVCNYLYGQSARSQVMKPEVINADVYGELVKAGFRRTGQFVYRPCCIACKACISVRIQADTFVPNRAQKRVQRAHGSLVASIAPFEDNPEHYRLYQRYQLARHGGVDADSEATEAEHPPSSHTPTQEEETARERYRAFLLRSPVSSRLIEFREPSSTEEVGALRMVTLMDIVEDGLSCVYTFYDPDIEHASFGTYSILWHIAQAKRLQLPYIYLGYWISESEKMAYKINFQPLEGFVKGKWVLLQGHLIIKP